MSTTTEHPVPTANEIPVPAAGTNDAQDGTNGDAAPTSPRERDTAGSDEPDAPSPPTTVPIRPGVGDRDPNARLVVVENYRLSSQSIEAPFWEHLYTGELPYAQSFSFECKLPPLDLIGEGFEIVASLTSTQDAAIVAEHHDAKLIVRATNDRTHFSVLARTPEALDRIVTELRAHEAGPSANDLEIIVWADGSYGPLSSRTTLESLDWDEHRANYPGEVREGMDRLTSLGRPTPGSGRLILFHGTAGTGKTTAIRLLASSWSEWCRLSYVSDPEQLFRSGQYMVSIASHRERNDQGPTLTAKVEQTEFWNLLVIEDGDLWMSGAARETEGGGGFQRLLNLTDGMLGQANNLIVLLTANVEDDQVDDALRRPGRCLADIDFRTFTEAEARTWARSRPEGATFDLAQVRGEQTLADLLALEGSLRRIGGPVPTEQPGQYL